MPVGTTNSHQVYNAIIELTKVKCDDLAAQSRIGKITQNDLQEVGVKLLLMISSSHTLQTLIGSVKAGFVGFSLLLSRYKLAETQGKVYKENLDL